MPIFFRSTRIFRVRQSSSAMSVVVTEPNSAPVGPDLTSKREHRLAQHVGDLVRLLERAGLVPGALLVDPLELGDAARRGRLGQLARQEVVAGVAAGDVHDLAAQTDLVHVREEDDLHG